MSFRLLKRRVLKRRLVEPRVLKRRVLKRRLVEGPIGTARALGRLEASCLWRSRRGGLARSGTVSYMLRQQGSPGDSADFFLPAAASQQRGVFTANQAYDAGYTPKEIQRLRMQGLLVSVRRGVYAASSTWRELDERERHLTKLAALRQVLAEPAVISHISAGVVHGLSLLSPDLQTLHVTRPGLGGSRREAGVRHHVAAIDEAEVLPYEQWQVTNLARTGIDIARDSALPAGVAALDSALRLGTDATRITDMLISCSNWPGARRAAHALALADGRAANAGESWSRVVLTREGVAPSDIQRKLYDEDGLVGIADFYWERERVVGELDGRQKYRVAAGADAEEAAEVVWAEKRREDRIRELGYEVVRWVYADLYQPAQLAARVRRALSRGAGRHRTTA